MDRIKSESRINPKIFSAVLRQIRTRPSLESVGVEQYRTLLEKSAAIFGIDKNIDVKRLHINSVINAECLTPEGVSGKQNILYLHGGGFIAGSVNSHRDLGARIAAASGAKLFMIDYRLAPEHKFPTGLNDAFNAYEWLLNSNIAPRDIIVAGDSAGGGLALSLLLKIKEHKLTLPRCAVFISPWVDLECRGKSHVRNRDKDPMLCRETLCYAAQLYTGGDYDDLSHPMISPVNGDLNGLCPVFIQAGSCEVLEDDAIMLENRAKDAGVTVTLEIWDGMFHVWHYFARYLASGQQAIEKIGAFIKKYSG